MKHLGANSFPFIVGHHIASCYMLQSMPLRLPFSFFPFSSSSKVRPPSSVVRRLPSYIVLAGRWLGGFTCLRLSTFWGPYFAALYASADHFSSQNGSRGALVLTCFLVSLKRKLLEPVPSRLRHLLQRFPRFGLSSLPWFLGF